MSIVVPRFPTVIDNRAGDLSLNTDLRAALPVRGLGQWSDYGAAVAWLAAQGGTLVMQGPSVGADVGNSQTWRWWAWPRYPIVARLWCVSLGMRTAAAANWHATGSITGIGRFTIAPDSFGRVTNLRYVQQVTATNTAGEITFVLNNDASSGGPVYMEGVTCYEIPRATIATFGAAPNQVTQLHTVQTGAPIVERETAANSLDGVLSRTLDEAMLQGHARRSCFWSDCRPTGQSPGTSYQVLYLHNPPVLARPRYLGESTRTIALAVYGSGPSGSTVRFTSDSDVATIALPTSNGWAFGTLDVDCDDPTEWGSDGGLQGGTRDRIVIEGRRVGGSQGDCDIFSTCMGEAAP